MRRFAAQGIDIKYFHREDRTGYKAGALEAGLKVASGEFVAIFDADFLPHADFLHRLLPHFGNDRVGVGLDDAARHDKLDRIVRADWEFNYIARRQEKVKSCCRVGGAGQKNRNMFLV